MDLELESILRQAMEENIDCFEELWQAAKNFPEYRDRITPLIAQTVDTGNKIKRLLEE